MTEVRDVQPVESVESVELVESVQPVPAVESVPAVHSAPAAALVRAHTPTPAPAPAPVPAYIEVLSPGPLTTVQDLGRPGHAAIGVGASGAADRGSLRLANRLVGNPEEEAAALELTYGGLRLRFESAATIALTGARCPIMVDDRAVGMDGPIRVRAGQQVIVGLPSEGLRTYLAVRGGIDVPPVLGSRSTDLLSGIGPPVLEAGTRLPIGQQVEGFPNVDFAPRRRDHFGPAILRVLPGPRDDWFVPEALDTLGESAYVVTNDSNRVGARLDGPALKRAVHEELPSEGAVSGALQVTPDGRPMLFLADHPVTGGYPVIAVVVAQDLDRAAQLRAGDAVRFRVQPPLTSPSTGSRL